MFDGVVLMAGFGHQREVLRAAFSHVCEVPHRFEGSFVADLAQRHVVSVGAFLHDAPGECTAPG